MQQNSSPNLILLYDPLCGWCYGALPAIKLLAQHYSLTLVPTGLFARPGNILNNGQAYWQVDQRISRLTGQVFSTSYKEQLLDQPSGFDSSLALLALSAVHQVAPELELSFLEQIQEARYIAGLDLTDPQVIEQLLARLPEVNLSLEQVISPAGQEKLNTLIKLGQKLATQVDAQGVPSLIDPQQGKVFPSQYLYSQPEKLLNRVQNFLA